MPRVADSTLHDRILEATHRIVHRKGIEAVTIREVAKAAATTTPTVYERFATKDALVLALADRIRQKLAVRILSARDLFEACAVYLDCAEKESHDYRLLYELGWPRIFERLEEQPALIWTMQKLAEMHGGRWEDYQEVAECLWIHVHGASTFLLGGAKSRFVKRFRELALHDCRVIIENAKLFRRSIPTKA